MNRYALALTAFGLFAGAACKIDDASTYEISDPATAQPVTLAINSGMT